MAQMAKKNEKGTVNKIRKFKLGKEQKLFVKNLLSLENRIIICQEYIALWLKYFQFFAGDIENKQIETAEEKAFFQSITTLARRQFQFTEAMGPAFGSGSDIMNVLSMSMSLAHIQIMDDNTRSKLELEWHTLLLEMNKSLGRMLRLLPGNMTLSEALEHVKKGKALDAKSIKAEGSKRRKETVEQDKAVKKEKGKEKQKQKA
jgi:hypothetical protein